MNDTIVKNTIKTVTETVNTNNDNTSINWWFWIAIFEFVVLLVLIIKRRNKSQSAKQKFKEKSLEQEIDFDNIINSSFHSKELYDELKVKCHPDRFVVDKEKNVIADAIFQEITKNRNNAKRLMELKEEAIEKLNINFK